MELYSPKAGRPAIAVTALAAAAGLILTGCGPSGGSNAAATRPSAAAKPSGTSSAANGSGSTVVSSGSVPFPTTPGDTWIYSNTNGSTSENKVASVTRVASGQKVRMDSTFKVNGQTSTSHFFYIVQPSGEISLPFSQFSSAVSGGSSFSVRLVSGGMFWPSAAQLASGRTEHSTLTLEYTLAGKTQRVTTHITATGEGIESVTVPAGTYQATVISMLESEKFDGISLSTDIKTWLAPGVGPVQSEILTMTGASTKISNKEVLTSFVKG